MSASAPPAMVAALFEECSDLVLRTAWRVTGRGEDAEDVLQGVFLQLLKATSPWPANPRAYVHRAAVNGALDVLRRRKRRSEEPIEDERMQACDGGETAAVDRLATNQMTERVRSALADLSPLEAEVFTLRCLEEVDAAEVASILGKTPNHVGVTLHAARAKLKKALAPESPSRASAPPMQHARGANP